VRHFQAKSGSTWLHDRPRPRSRRPAPTGLVTSRSLGGHARELLPLRLPPLKPSSLSSLGGLDIAPTAITESRSGKKERRIMRSLMIGILVLSGVSLLTFVSLADAAGPAQADFDTCNKEAHAQASSPSAAPATETPSTRSPSPASGADTGTKPGTPVSPSAAQATQTPPTPSRLLLGFLAPVCL
jgi:hypothetical protein